MATTMFMLDDLVPLIYSYVKPTPEQHRIWRIKKNREAIISNWKDEELDGGYALIKLYMVSYITEEFADECSDPDDGVYVITTEEDFEYKFNDDPYMYQNIIDEDNIGYKDINYIEKYIREGGWLDGEYKSIEDKINLVTYLLACELWSLVEAEEVLEPVNIND
tara:strand:- start:151 stop:642 length:492 start_codon:yes stop_codon:yes gene_type:complete